jgi:hypothetical protein
LNAAPDQIWKWCFAGQGCSPPSWLNIGRRDYGSVRYFLLEIGDDNIQGAPGQKFGFCVLEA